jgi:hypothetical protein
MAASNSTVVDTLAVGYDPKSLVFDNKTEVVYAANNGQGTLSMLNWPAEYVANFSESTLPPGSEWWVNLTGNISLHSSTANISFTAQNGTYDYTATTTNKSYTSPSGSLTLNGSNTVVPIVFSRESSYGVNFTESGIPLGRSWSVNLAGSVETNFSVGTQPSSLTFQEFNGTYAFAVTPPTRYAATPSNGTLTVNGTNVSVAIAFSPSPANDSYPILFIERGIPVGLGWEIQIGNLTRFANVSSNQGNPLAGGRSVEFDLTNGTYSPEVWSPSGFEGLPYFSNITVAGRGQNLTIDFVELFEVAFTEQGLPAGLSWSITYGGWTKNLTVLSGVASEATYFYPNQSGPVLFEVRSPPGYVANPSSGSIPIAGSDVFRTIEFAEMPQTYSVIFSEWGLPNGTSWSVDLNGTSDSGVGSLTFKGLPNDTYPFAVPPTDGVNATPPNGSVLIAGAPVRWAIVFGPLPEVCPGTQTTGFQAPEIVCPPLPHGTAPTTFLGLPPIEGYALLAGLVLLVVLGVLVYVVRRRRDLEP